jgi:hypothetical protein
MIPYSDNFKKALLSSKKTLYIKMEMYNSEMNFIESIEKQVSENDIGNISVDKSRPIRRNFSFSLVNKDNKYTWGDKNTIWIDKRVKIYTGLKLKDGTIEYLPQGIFLLTEPQSQHSPSGNITSISGVDKAYLYNDKRGKLINNLTIAEGISVTTAIKTIAEGETLFLFDNVTETVPYELSYNAGENRWKIMSDLAAFAKAEIFYDVNGYLRLKKVEDLNDLQNESAVWSFTKGDMFYAGNVRKMDESNTYNHFIAIGGGTETEVVRDEIIITESNPIWANSPYSIEKIGRCVYFHNDGNSDSLLTTVEECHWRNKYELMNRLGYSEQISLNIAPLFVLDASDIINVEDSENGVTGRYMVNKFDIPLKPQLVTVECSKEVEIVTDWSAI